MPENPSGRVSQVAHDGWVEHFLCAESPDELRRFLDATGATLINAEWFGDADCQTPAGLAPVATVRGRGPGGGLHAHAVTGITPTLIRDAGRVVGAWVEDAAARWCWLGDVRPGNIGASREEQAATTFADLERLLQLAGMDFRHVYRTWFYLDQILEWYGPFNRVRNEFFRARNIFGGIMPASTGVGAANLTGAAVLARAAAVQPKDGRVQIARVDSPLQCSAYDYGSAFSRAVKVTEGRRERLFVSGTASIEPGGKTTHIGDTWKQIERTVEVVAAILDEAGAAWGDVRHMLAYFRDAGEIGLWSEFTRRRGLPSLPVVVTQCDICRDDLLFEIELMASYQSADESPA